MAPYQIEVSGNPVGDRVPDREEEREVGVGKRRGSLDREERKRNQILSRREEERNWGKRKRSERMNLILKAKTKFPRAISTNECEDLMPIAECRMPIRGTLIP